MKLSATCLFLSALAAAGSVSAQPSELSFEAATVKPNHTGDGAIYSRFGGVTVSLVNLSLKRMIVFAYQIRDFQLTGGPPWIDSDRFDVEGKTTPEATIDQKRAMVQSLLKDRFQLALHRETRELPTYNLIVARSGLKLQPLKQGECIPRNLKPPDSCAAWSMGPTMIQGRSATIPDLAMMLSVILGRTLVDKTGVVGQFRFQLNFAPVDASLARPADGAADAPSIFTALQEQLGLKLAPSKGPVEVMVVDHAEKPSEN